MAGLQPLLVDSQTMIDSVISLQSPVFLSWSIAPGTVAIQVAAVPPLHYAPGITRMDDDGD